MSGAAAGSPLCARVFERLVEAGEVGADPVLSEHLGSCVTCFRTLTELRDVPRLAGLLRETAPVAPAADDRFWEALAARTTAAVAAAEARTASPSMQSSAAPTRRSEARGRPWASSFRGRVAITATAVAAAVAFAVVRRPPAGFATRTQPAATSGAVVAATRSTGDDEAGEVAADVADLDGTALRRLLDRLRTGAPAVLTAFPSGDAADATDGLGDDDRRVNDEVADLDGTALRRVASSLEASPL
jgi:hypothetical protein